MLHALFSQRWDDFEGHTVFQSEGSTFLRDRIWMCGPQSPAQVSIWTERAAHAVVCADAPLLWNPKHGPPLWNFVCLCCIYCTALPVEISGAFRGGLFPTKHAAAELTVDTHTHTHVHAHPEYQADQRRACNSSQTNVVISVFLFLFFLEK